MGGQHTPPQPEFGLLGWSELVCEYVSEYVWISVAGDVYGCVGVARGGWECLRVRVCVCVYTYLDQ